MSVAASPEPFRPPARFADATFASYRPETEQQANAADAARAFTERIRRAHTRSWLGRVFGKDEGIRDGLYLVGPVGTGKTHLLTAIYKALTAPDVGDAVPCAFTHSSDLFRSTERPVAYAARVAGQARVLLIDEVELDDPAGEVRLIGVLKALREHGVTVAATSNAEPEKFVSARFGRDRLERFINEEFRERYHVVFVEGEDYRNRLEKRGTAWIGPLGPATAVMRAHFETHGAGAPKAPGAPANAAAPRWITFGDAARASRARPSAPASRASSRARPRSTSTASPSRTPTTRCACSASSTTSTPPSRSRRFSSRPRNPRASGFSPTAAPASRPTWPRNSTAPRAASPPCARPCRSPQPPPPPPRPAATPPTDHP